MKSKDYLKFRSVWMGIAMLWIVFYHSAIGFSNQLVNTVKGFGYGGVDICLFASGIGCYFSLSKDPDPGRFMKRRLVRVYPTYVCFLVPWILWQMIMKGDPMPMQAVLGNIFCIQYLTSLGHGFNWYMSAIFLYYILAPYLKYLADRVNGRRSQAMVVFFLLLLSVPFWKNRSYIIMMTRIPIFYIGMLAGKKYSAQSMISRREMVIQIFAAAAGVGWLLINEKFFFEKLWSYGLHWYPFILVVPGMCIAISCVAELMNRYKIGQRIVSAVAAVGTHSLEIYLVHLLVFDVLEYMIRSRGLLPNTYFVWFGALVCVMAGSVALRGVVQSIRRLPCFRETKCCTGEKLR